MNSLNLEQYQQQMGAFLRDPEKVSMPSNLDERRAGVYKDLVFANIESQLSGAFPVIHSLFEGERWLRLVREFLVDYRAQTPYFTKLSEEFVSFLAQRKKDEETPGFLLELAHYERVEIDLFMQDEAFDRIELSANDLSDRAIGFISTTTLLAYAYPVHRIAPDYQPEEAPAVPTLLLLFQDSEGEVRFFELQPLAYQLATKIAQESGKNASELLEELAGELNLPFTETFKEQALQLLQQLNSLKVLRTI
jgi:hypothetical protein